MKAGTSLEDYQDVAVAVHNGCVTWQLKAHSSSLGLMHPRDVTDAMVSSSTACPAISPACLPEVMETVISGIAAPDRQAVQGVADPDCALSSSHLG